MGRGDELFVSVTVWPDGEDPGVCDLALPLPAGGIRWYDVASTATADGLMEAIGPSCAGLTREMLADLLRPDEVPEGRRWRDGDVRLASSFAVYAPEARDGAGLKPAFTPSAEAVYEPVELVAGRDWLITRWHDACLYRGAEPVQEGLPPMSRDELFKAVSKRWLAKGRGSAGDLGVLVIHELALTYAPTQRRFHIALGEWELELYGREAGGVNRDSERRLHDLWGACARLRDWLNPLNVPGLKNDPGRAWLPAGDHEEVLNVDERIVDAQRELAKLGDTLRSSFQLLHIQKAEEQRERNERLQRRLGILAPIFVVPTLIVGFYGANTWVPGEHRHWGFLVMVAAIVVLTSLTATAIWAATRGQLE